MPNQRLFAQMTANFSLSLPFPLDTKIALKWCRFQAGKYVRLGIDYNVYARVSFIEFHFHSFFFLLPYQDLCCSLCQ